MKCRNCPLNVWYDKQDRCWRHVDHEGESCGESAPDHYAEPIFPASIGILWDSPAAGGTGRWFVLAEVAGTNRDWELGAYITGGEAGAAASKWAKDRGLRWSPDAVRCLDKAQRCEDEFVRLNLVVDGPD